MATQLRDPHQRDDWWTHFFEGLPVTLWLQAISPGETQRQADSIVSLIAPRPGARLLDVPCGGGRLALALAARGYQLTGVDLSGEFLAHARHSEDAARVQWEERDMRTLPWERQFDGAYCVGNSFGYFDAEGNASFLRAVAATLKPGARFILETPMIVENLLPHIQRQPWWKVGDMYLLVSNTYDHLRGRLEIDYTFIQGDRIDTRHGSHQAYRYAELAALLDACGFEVAAAEPWTKDAHTVTFIATRR